MAKTSSMKDAKEYLILDYETRSEADLRKVGSWEYSAHPSTRVLCAAWKFGTREKLRKAQVGVYSPAFKDEKNAASLGFLINCLKDKDVIIVAHNALFEQVITRNVLLRGLDKSKFSIDPPRWRCTAALASSYALPRKLEGAGSALGLKIQKDKEGHRLMLKMSKPRKPSKKNPAKWHNSLSDLKRLIEYCKTDVEAETELFLTLPPLPPMEQKIWELDQKINLRGFKADRELVKSVLKMIETETKNLNAETEDMTFGGLVSATQRDGVLRWLESEGVFLSDLRAKTVSDALATGIVDGESKRILEIRQAISKTSTAKYQAFEMRSRFDSRVRDILVYHTATTGRWGGAGVQPQNFPRPLIPQEWIDHVIEIIQPVNTKVPVR